MIEKRKNSDDKIIPFRAAVRNDGQIEAGSQVQETINRLKQGERAFVPLINGSGRKRLIELDSEDARALIMTKYVIKRGVRWELQSEKKRQDGKPDWLQREIEELYK